MYPYSSCQIINRPVCKVYMYQLIALVELTKLKLNPGKL